MNNMGYELKGNGFINPGGALEFDKDDKSKITKVDSKYIWAYLVSDNGIYMVKNNNVNLGDFFSHIFDIENWGENWGAGMINFDNWSVDNWLDSVKFDRENKEMTISIPNRDGLTLAKDTTTYNIDGWAGRYGKPLEFLLSLHLATMAPDLTYELATNKNFETTVHVNMLKVKLKIETVIHANGDTYTFEDFKNFVNQGNGNLPVTFLPPKGYYIDEDENKIPIYYTFGEVYEALKEVNDENFWTYLPYIKWVEKHWFRDVYFDVDAEDIKIYTNNVKGEKTSSITVVEKEEKDDGEYWDKYNSLDEYGYSDELATKEISGIHVYRIIEDGDYPDLENSILNGSILQNFNTEVNIEGYKIVQVADAERGVTNKAIKDLFAEKYYIYDGTEITADNIEKAALAKNENIKREISITRDSLAAFTILENTHTLDADYIYKDLKELLVELKYFKQDEMIGDNIKVLKWPVPEYNKENGYKLWPDSEIDKPVYEYGTYITSKSNYGDNGNARINNTKIASLEFISGAETLEIAANEGETANAQDQETKEKNEGYESGKDVVSPANGKIESTSNGIKITIDDSQDYITKNGENICSGYQLVMSGFNISKSSGEVKAGEKIGTTTDENIKLILLDEDKAVVEDIQEYIILPGEEKEEKNVTYGEGYDLDQYGEQGNGNNSDNNGGENNGGNTGNNNGGQNNGGENNGGNNNSNENNNNGSSTAEIKNDYNVNTTSGENVFTREQILKAVKQYYSNQEGIKNIESAMDAFMKIQNEYNVNAIFAIAVVINESSAGTNWNLINPNTYNWYSVKDGSGNWKTYSNFSEATIDFGGLIGGIGGRGMYFRLGKYKVSEIALTYCDEAWGRAVNNTMTNIINNIK